MRGRPRNPAPEPSAEVRAVIRATYELEAQLDAADRIHAAECDRIIRRHQERYRDLPGLAITLPLSHRIGRI
jgi:hypothetical protein